MSVSRLGCICGLCLAGFGRFAQTHRVEDLRLAEVEVVLSDLAVGEGLVENAKLFEQRVLIGTVFAIVFLLRCALSVANGLLFGLLFLLTEFALALLVRLWAGGPSDRLLRRL